ncbi:MAG: TIGR01212 family radical SAM protein, partial [Planctomycetota bacterium]
SERKSVADQVKAGIDVLSARYRARKFIAYFQAFTNTYAPPDRLKALYDEALAVEDVIGLSIGTRPDCVPHDVLDLIASYLPRLDELWLEYGLQSIHPQTLDLVNRAHHVEEFVDAVRRTRARGIKICVHVILGLPGETPEMMFETADALSRLPIDGLKLHHLYVAKGAPLADAYARGDLETLSASRYADLASRFLERIPSSVTIQRLVGDVSGDLLIAPRWPEPKQRVLAMITDALRSRDSCQGKLLE